VSRFLFVVPPFSGHVNPTLAVGAELVQRGHEVAWTGVPGGVDPLLPEGARFEPACSIETTLALSAVADRAPGLRGAGALKFLWEDVLLPLADAMVDGVDEACDRFGADVLVVDQQALAGAVVAGRRAMPWATSATTSAEITDPLAALPLVGAAISDACVALQERHGVTHAEATHTELRFSPHLVLVFSTEELVGAETPFPQHYKFVGPSISGRPETVDFPWDELDPGLAPVLVSLGTLNADAGERFFGVAAEAFRDQPWQGIFVAPPDLVHDAPANIIVRPRVPQLALLQRVQAVVSHAGHNTVCESLAAGLPMVLAPIRDDQPIIADQVFRAGAGVRLKFTRVRAPDLRAAVDSALTDPVLKAGAEAISASFTAAGGSSAAATALEALSPG
jgi:MGT family glycosyltransferase